MGRAGRRSRVCAVRPWVRQPADEGGRLADPPRSVVAPGAPAISRPPNAGTRTAAPTCARQVPLRFPARVARRCEFGSQQRVAAPRGQANAAGLSQTAGVEATQGAEATQELKRMSEALRATALVCRWLVRNRARRMAPLDAGRQELDGSARSSRSRRQGATRSSSSGLCSIASSGGLCAGATDSPQPKTERASVERDEAIRERECAPQVGS